MVSLLYCSSLHSHSVEKSLTHLESVKLGILVERKTIPHPIPSAEISVLETHDEE